MSLNRGKLNPLSVLGLRKLNVIPEHFSTINVDSGINTKMIDQWINYNLNSRYAIIRSLSLDQNKKMIEILEIGLEDPREITILTLGCPYLHR
jgi:hypothetical protein